MTLDQLASLLKIAHVQAALSTQLYAGRVAVREYAESLHARYRYMEVAHVRAAALITGSQVYLAVCGSDDLYDVVQDCSAHQVSVDGLLCHEGFSDAADILLRQIQGSGVMAAIPDRELILGGHSAGGAIAEVLAMHPGLEPDQLHTFGSPRVWASGAAPTCGAQPWRRYRWVMAHDPFQHLPLRRHRLLFGGAQYSHASAPWELTADGVVLLDQRRATVRWLAHAAANWWTYGMAWLAKSLWLLPKMVRRNHAHSCQEYADRLYRAAKRVGA